MAEDAVFIIVHSYMRLMSEQEEDDLFGFDAPFGTFSAKIRLAYAFRLIDQDLRDDFDRVRDIRNAFAHAPFP